MTSNDNKKTQSTTARKLYNGFFWNVLGQVVPALTAIVSIPPLINNLGGGRFGFLSMAWVVIGYFSVLDLGVSRTLTFLIAGARGSSTARELQEICGAGCGILLIWALLLAVGIRALGGYWVQSLVSDAQLLSEIDASVTILASCIPLVMLFQVAKGVLEAYQEFQTLNLVKIPLGIGTFAVPAILSFVDQHLIFVVLSICIVRFVGAIVIVIACAKLTRLLPWKLCFDAAVIRKIFSYGSWITLSGLVSPLMVYSDRFVLGATVGLALVAFYAVPFDILTKALLLPAAMSAAVFPAFVAALNDTPKELSKLYSSAQEIAVAPMCLAFATIVPVMPLLFSYWLDVGFAMQASKIAVILCIGIVLNGAAHIPYALVQAAGRTDFTAALHLIELPVYFCALFWMVNSYGLIGAAVAWTFRAALDLIALSIWIAASRLVVPRVSPFLVVSLALFAFAIAIETLVLDTHWRMLVSGLCGVVALIFISFEWQKAKLVLRENR